MTGDRGNHGEFSSLRTRGPDLLYLMRVGTEHEEQIGEGASPLTTMPKGRRTMLWTSLFVGAIAMFPQALVPMGMKLSGSVERVWFLALHRPEQLQWPTTVFMTEFGLAAFGFAAWIYLSGQRTTESLGRRSIPVDRIRVGHGVPRC